jgi:hypothetical protein
VPAAAKAETPNTKARLGSLFRRASSKKEIANLAEAGASAVASVAGEDPRRRRAGSSTASDEQEPLGEGSLFDEEVVPEVDGIGGAKADNGGARIDFVLKSDGWRGEAVMGVASILLRQMLASGEDKPLVALELRDRTGAVVAQLHAGLIGLHALRLAWWHAARKEHVGVSVHHARLLPRAIEAAAGGGPLSAWVEVDVAGIVPPEAAPAASSTISTISTITMAPSAVPSAASASSA